MRIHFGPGYRVYIGEDGSDIWVLWAGVKNTQQSDIERAKRYWREYKDGKQTS